MPRLLVTGASGFLGRNLMPLLTASDSGYEVHSISSSAQLTDADSDAIWHQVDLTDAAAVQHLVDDLKPEILVHLAWFNGKSADRYNDQQNHVWVDVTVNLVAAFAKAGGRRALIVGSGIEYGPHHGPISESLEPNPTTLYGKCKAEVAEAVMALGEQYENLSVCIPRPYFLLGPYEEQARLAPTVAIQLLRGEVAELSAGTQRRDYIHSADVASALLALIDSDIVGPVNIARGEAISVRELAEKIASHTGREDLLWFGARPAGGDVGDEIVADIGLITSATQWRPKYDMDAAAADVVRWWRSQLFTEQPVVPETSIADTDKDSN